MLSNTLIPDNWLDPIRSVTSCSDWGPETANSAQYVSYESREVSIRALSFRNGQYFGVGSNNYQKV